MAAFGSILDYGTVQLHPITFLAYLLPTAMSTAAKMFREHCADVGAPAPAVESAASKQGAGLPADVGGRASGSAGAGSLIDAAATDPKAAAAPGVMSAIGANAVRPIVEVQASSGTAYHSPTFSPTHCLLPVFKACPPEGFDVRLVQRVPCTCQELMQLVAHCGLLILGAASG